jgi:hypothetical protein
VQTAHGITQSPDHPTTDYPTCATIPGPLHQVSYSCHDPCCCPSCHTYHLHTMRQANVILHTNKIKVVQPPKYPVFEFKPRRVNDSSQTNQEIDHLISHFFSSDVLVLSPLHFGLPLFSSDVFVLNPLHFGIASFFIECLYFEPTIEGCDNAFWSLTLAYLL